MYSTPSMSISDLRKYTAETVNRVVNEQQPVVIMQRSQPRAVLVDSDYFQSLEEAVLDLTDAREADRSKSEPKRPLQDYLDERWGKDGV
jgi:prevent-host-death family protein